MLREHFLIVYRYQSWSRSELRTRRTGDVIDTLSQQEYFGHNEYRQDILGVSHGRRTPLKPTTKKQPRNHEIPSSDCTQGRLGTERLFHHSK